MSTNLPETVDAARMLSGRRCFEGSLPISMLPRFAEALERADGEVAYALEFGRDAVGVEFLEIRAQCAPWLTCQRTLEPYQHPLDVLQRLGLIRKESDEAGLPEGYEPLLLPEDRQLHPRDLIEDELILALPLVPARPDAELPPQLAGAAEAEPEAKPNPFAALAALKKN
ncbi:YceD family protein [Aquimonas voraii]|uniref:Large ribosomal RNA subunit accumulation protein YceD n=1 Tax=Aquimonas voraii TaxID=265719 RepID=A0A1G6RTJ6_9GAMM|nr:YceD family protein [Aquimonas voraii]SDD07307.1 uncharacterized protein SAMN04488509_10164 [Aquimonas voraii]